MIWKCSSDVVQRSLPLSACDVQIGAACFDPAVNQRPSPPFNAGGGGGSISLHSFAGFSKRAQLLHEIA